jgi:DNA polymerase I
VETVELFLLGGSYQTVEDGVVIELFGRDRQGGSLIARYPGFRPYFDLVEPTDDSLARLRADPELVGLEDRREWVQGGERRVVRVTIKFPWKVPEYRDRYRRPEFEPSVLACDIPFVHRFLYDKGIGLFLRFEAEPEVPEIAQRYTGQRVVRVVVSEGHDIRPAEAFRPTLTVLSFDIENAIRERTIYTLCGTIHRGGEEIGQFRLAGSETGILDGFVAKVEEIDPDVITGYNIGGYDFPLLIERAQALGRPELLLGRNRTAPKEAGERLWRIDGRVVADAWWSVRRDLRPKQESLQFVARTLLGDAKLDVDRRNIAAEWEKDPIKVQEYCEHDARLAYRILERLRTLDRAADLATVAHLPLEEGMNGRTSQYIDALLIPAADRHGIGVPPSHRTGRESTIEGGYVHAIRPGIYRWVVVLDFKSMYPSIIIARNLCFTTLSPEGTTVAPSGARFLAPTVREGLIPVILRGLMEDRDRFRKLSRTSETEELRAYYDGLQNAVKILMNSFYGVLASAFYRFTNKDIGAAITAFARESITGIIQSLATEGQEVVYSDTDSVFVKSPEPTLEGSKRFGESLAKRFSAEGVTFEFQSVYDSFFSHGAKKRYVGRTAWPKDELVIRGYETRRTDAFDFQSEALLEIFGLVLAEDTDRAVQRARELVKQVADGKVPPERLVIARSVRAEEQYNEATRDALPFLRVFRRLKEEGYDVIPGMKVAWIVTDARQTPQAIEPWMEGRPFLATPDYVYYAERVAQTLARVTEVFNWDATALLKGSHQRRLSEPAPAATPGEPAPGPKVALDTPIGEASRPRKTRQSSFE